MLQSLHLRLPAAWLCTCDGKALLEVPLVCLSVQSLHQALCLGQNDDCFKLLSSVHPLYFRYTREQQLQTMTIKVMVE